jgi:hypothetical protein
VRRNLRQDAARRVLAAGAGYVFVLTQLSSPIPAESQPRQSVDACRVRRSCLYPLAKRNAIPPPPETRA